MGKDPRARARPEDGVWPENVRMPVIPPRGCLLDRASPKSVSAHHTAIHLQVKAAERGQLPRRPLRNRGVFSYTSPFTSTDLAKLPPTGPLDNCRGQPLVRVASGIPVRRNARFSFLIREDQQRGSQLGGLGVIRQVEMTPASREPVSWHAVTRDLNRCWRASGNAVF